MEIKRFFKDEEIYEWKQTCLPLLYSEEEA